MKSIIFKKEIAFKLLPILVFSGILIPLNSCMEDEEDLRKQEEAEIQEYIEKNNITVQPTESGLYYIETKEGDGRKPVEGDSVLINYIWENLTDYILGTNIESVAKQYSIWDPYTTYEPYGFAVGSPTVIKGWNEGIKFMKEGGEATLLLPSSLAFYDYKPVVYEITLLKVYSEEEELELLDQYLLDNNITEEPKESGLYYIETEAGTGVQPQQGDTVDVHYTGRLIDSTIFDTSAGSDPFSFVLGEGEVIQGWDEGVGYMNKGGKAILIVPSSLGYGSAGKGSIPPYSTLIFDVELVDVR